MLRNQKKMWKQITFFFSEREHLRFTETAENKLAIDGGYRRGHETNRWPAGGAATLLGLHTLMETSFFLSFFFFNLVLATPPPPAPCWCFLTRRTSVRMTEGEVVSPSPLGSGARCKCQCRWSDMSWETQPNWVLNGWKTADSVLHQTNRKTSNEESTSATSPFLKVPIWS